MLHFSDWCIIFNLLRGLGKREGKETAQETAKKRTRGERKGKGKRKAKRKRKGEREATGIRIKASQKETTNISPSWLSVLQKARRSICAVS